VRKLCGVHMEVFKAAMEENKLEVPHWHPVHIQIEEHVDMTNKVSLMKVQVHALLHGAEGEEREGAKAKLAALIDYYGKAESNFLKQENVFFPILERHGIVQPCKVMWAEHDELRGIQKRMAALAAKGIDSTIASIRDSVLEYENLLTGHVQKEQTILFPAALKTFSDEEWGKARREFDDIGYFAFYPIPLGPESGQPGSRGASSDVKDGQARETSDRGVLDLDTGYLSREQLLAMMRALPVDISFVDHEDKVKYFNDTPERIFVRTKAVIGRSVQNCHPQKSVHIVNQILEDFRSGKKDHEDFWIKMGPKFILIRYFAVRSPEGGYLGALEVSQDAAPIRALEGEKRIVG
jgi:uncharacterized protein